MNSNKTDVNLAQVTLHPAAESDFAQWLPLWKSYQTFLSRRHPGKHHAAHLEALFPSHRADVLRSGKNRKAG
ncbi:Histone acetyltransferase HPA2 related acetyltransferase [Klebsiella michiganensis]|nr:Histone acetyltransferase HPA2 related acetyltransferase [Klebsiella michiganensis]